MSREQLAFSFDAPDATTPYTLTCADVLTWAQSYTGPKFMAALLDPPYSLGDGKKGFMNAAWDTSIAFKPETWKALAQHLLPGAFIMAFASSRGFHRVMTAMEDAGLRLYPAIFNWRTGETHEIGLYGWANGSSFPKATRIDTVLEKQRHDDVRPICRFLETALMTSGLRITDIVAAMGFAGGGDCGVSAWFREDHVSPRVPTCEQWIMLKGILSLADEMDAEVWRLNGRKGQPGETWVQREVIGQQTKGSSPLPGNHDGTWADSQQDGTFDLTAPATPLAQTWAGHRYGGQVLKNSLEPVIVAQVPYDKKPVQSITETGAGALNIEFARLGWDADGLAGDRNRRQSPRADITGNKYGAGGCISGAYVGESESPSGRWPPNFALCHAHLPDELCHADSCPVAKLDAQAGVRTSGGDVKPYSRLTNAQYSGGFPDNTSVFKRDTGNVSRFFHVSSWSMDVAEQLAQADPVRYCPKASRGERDKGLEGMPLAEMIIYSKQGQGPLAQQTPRKPVQQRNVHPTVKPLALCQWLATLLLPPDAYAPRRLLVPFSGTGSEAIGAMLAGWDEIVLVEQDAAYVELAERRLAYWAGRRG